MDAVESCILLNHQQSLMHGLLTSPQPYLRGGTEFSHHPVGKQRIHPPRGPSGIFYTAASGIWQTVWLEPVSPSSLYPLLVPLLFSLPLGGQNRGPLGCPLNPPRSPPAPLCGVPCVTQCATLSVICLVLGSEGTVVICLCTQDCVSDKL